MKSRTSSSKSTLLKKNITRFAPIWGLYILCLLLGLMILSGGDKEFYVVMNMGECARIMALVNCGYALVVAQVLFGDLFDSRMCSGIHCLPLRREQIFGVNILSGFLFSLVPTLIMAAVSLPLMLGSRVVNAWMVSFLWLLAANLEFLFFFGLAVLCVFFTGNRFSMAVVYGIANLWSLLLMLVVEAIYEPMLWGVSMDNSWFQVMSPLMQIMESPLIIVSRLEKTVPGTFEIQDSWGYLWFCAGVGLVLLVLALLLYRRRKLETAGEFLSVKAAKPVFLVIFSLVAASGFAMVSQQFFGYQERFAFGMVFASVGLVVGWFVGAMLVAKSTRVFHKKNILGAVILLAILLTSFLLTRMDIFGVRRYVPQWEDVAWIRMTEYEEDYYPRIHDEDFRDHPELAADRITDRASIERAIRLHELALEQNITESQVREMYRQYYEAAQAEEDTSGISRPTPFSLEYTLKDGRVVRRYYYIYNEGEAAELAARLLSRPEILLGKNMDADWAGEGGVYLVRMDQTDIPTEYMTDTDMEALKQAILADCLEGNMAQVWEMHKIPVFVHPDYPKESIYLEFYWETDGVWFHAFGDSRHTLQWLRERGLLDLLRSQWQTQIEEDFYKG